MSTGNINYNSAIRYPEGCPVSYNGWICKVVCHKEQYTRRLEQIKPMPGSPLVRVANSELGKLVEARISKISYYLPHVVTPVATGVKPKTATKPKLIGLN